MDVNAFIDRAIVELETNGEISMDSDMMRDILETADCALHGDAHAEAVFCHEQPQSDSNLYLGAAPLIQQQPVLPAPARYAAPPFPVLQPGPWYNQGPGCSHGQFNSLPVVDLHQGLTSNLTAVGHLNGEVIYKLPTYTAPAVAWNHPPVNCLPAKKTKRRGERDDLNAPYVKKPPNAFMLFRKEQRPRVVAEIDNGNCAAVNTILGQRWKAMSKEEQAYYYKEAERERQRHAQDFPDWSACHNYGKKRKRIRRKGPVMSGRPLT